MSIIIPKDGKNSKKVDQSSIELETKLQAFIYDNPDTIPLYDIDQNIRLFIAAREFQTLSGPIDAIGFDIMGNIYVIEAKLYKNPDKRTVVSQALDYGASLWRNFTDFDDFLVQLNLHTNKQFGLSFEDKYKDFFGIDDVSENFLSIKENLSEGSIKFVVLMDKLYDSLKNLIIYVNQNSKFDLYAVELEYYKHEEFEIVIPKLFGAEVKKDVPSTGQKSSQAYTPSTVDEFNRYVEKHFIDSELSELGRDSVFQLAKYYTDFTNKTNGTISYWRAHTKLRDVIKVILHSNNKVTFYLDSDGSFGAYPGGKSGVHVDFTQNVLRRMIEEGIMKKSYKHLQGSQWFTNIKKSTTNDSEIESFVKINKQVIDDIVSSLH